VDPVLVQVCSFNFAALNVEAHPLIMTIMMGVSVLIVPQGIGERRYWIWCDPSFGAYFTECVCGVTGGETFDPDGRPAV
jgi:sarcosine oxidase subunit gamma